jgi:hypothetical protein
LVRGFGEPLLSRPESSVVHSLLQECGFEIVEDMGPAEYGERYFEGRADGFRPPTLLNLVQARKV